MSELDLDALEKRANRIKDDYGVLGGPFFPGTVLALIQRLRKAEQDADTNAPWLTLAHTICTDAGVPQGRIEWRLESLREIIESLHKLILSQEVSHE